MTGDAASSGFEGAPEGPAPSIIHTPAGLNDLCARLVEAGRFGFDTEFIMEADRPTEVCLLQTATEDDAALIDPLGGLDIQPLWEVVADEHTEVILHSGKEDMAICRAMIGRPPRRIFDVQVAAAMVGMEFSLGLGRLLELTLGVRPHRTQTLSNWKRRPLSSEQVRYAVDDVWFLPKLHRLLRSRLEALGRTEWAAEEFAGMESAVRSREEREDFFRARGAQSLNRAELAVLRELFRARQSVADELSCRTRQLMRDDQLVQIVRHRWTRPEQIASLRGLTRSRRDPLLDALCKAIADAKSLPEDQWPAIERPRRETPDEQALISLLGAVVRAHCAQHDIAPQLVATHADVHGLVLARMDGSDGLASRWHGWRYEFIGRLLDDVLTGKVNMRVVGTRPHLKIDCRRERGDDAVEES